MHDLMKIPSAEIIFEAASMMMDVSRIYQVCDADTARSLTELIRDPSGTQAAGVEWEFQWHSQSIQTDALFFLVTSCTSSIDEHIQYVASMRNIKGATCSDSDGRDMMGPVSPSRVWQVARA